MIRINQTMTERLQSNAPLPVYAGPLELPKLMNAPNVSTHQSSKGVKEGKSLARLIVKIKPIEMKRIF